MDILKRVLAVMVTILVIVVGAGLYYATRHGGHNLNNLLPDNKTGQQVQQAPDTKTANQKVNVILEPDLRNYIDELNKGISLINEANGLITADPFFADPPKVPKGKLETTPFDKEIPKDRDNPILLLPDGTYQIIRDTGSDMRDIHRGIYKLGQGMTVLNSVLDRMNEDIKSNNFPAKTNQSASMPYNWQNYYTGMQNMPGMTTTPGAATMPGMTSGQGTDAMAGMAHGATGSALFNRANFSNILYLVLIVFLLMAIVSIIGFVFSLFKPKASNGE